MVLDYISKILYLTLSQNYDFVIYSIVCKLILFFSLILSIVRCANSDYVSVPCVMWELTPPPSPHLYDHVWHSVHGLFLNTYWPILCLDPPQGQNCNEEARYLEMYLSGPQTDLLYPTRGTVFSRERYLGMYLSPPPPPLWGVTFIFI